MTSPEIPEHLDDAELAAWLVRSAGTLAAGMRAAVVTFDGDVPTTEQLDALHHDAHDNCFIAHSVKTDVRCKPRQETA